MKKKDIQGIESMNKDLYDEMYVNELESRLETDPLLANGLLDLVSSANAAPEDIDLLCNNESMYLNNYKYIFFLCVNGTAFEW